MYGHNVQLLQNFIQNNCLVADLRFQTEINFTYEGGAHSWIDHIMFSDSCVNFISNVSQLDLAGNLSDRYPLKLFFKSCVHSVLYLAPLDSTLQ